MRVALVFFLKDSFGGAERRLTRVYNELCGTDRSIRCDIIVRGCSEKTAIKLFGQADCDISSIYRIIAFRNQAVCLAYLLIKRYDLIHFFDACGFNIAIEKMGKLTAKKTLYSVCNYNEISGFGLEENISKIRQQLKLADYVDLLYPSGKDYVTQYITGKLSVTPGSFTDLSIFTPSPKENTIVYAAARLETAKNPMLLVEAVNLCKDIIRKKGFHAVLLGKGALESELKRSINAYGIDDILFMPGYVKTSEYTPKASVFLSLQSRENYPSQSLAEAAASGCYLIITDVGDSRKCADESFAAFVRDDPKELAAALIRYMKMDCEEKAEIVKNARSFAEKNYSIELSKEYFRNLLEDTGKRRKR